MSFDEDDFPADVKEKHLHELDVVRRREQVVRRRGTAGPWKGGRVCVYECVCVC